MAEERVSNRGPSGKGTEDRIREELQKERERFYKIVGEKRDQTCVHPCFMTGMGCVHVGEIQRSPVEANDRKRLTGFMVMPFEPNLEVFYQNTLRRFFERNYSDAEHEVTLRKSDDGSNRTGTIICDGICRRIQEADFVVADISVPNENVFYEIGLAYGIGKPLVLVAHAPGGKPDANQFAQRMGKYFSNHPFFEGGEDEQVDFYGYHDLNALNVIEPNSPDGSTASGFCASAIVVRRQAKEPKMAGGDRILGEGVEPVIRFVELTWKQGTGAKGDWCHDDAAVTKPHDAAHGKERASPTPDTQLSDTSKVRPRDIELSFATHVKSDVGLAIASLQDQYRRAESGQEGRASQKADREGVGYYGSDQLFDENRGVFLEVEANGKLVKSLRVQELRHANDREHANGKGELRRFQNSVDASYCLIIRTGRDCHPLAYFWLGYAHARGKNVVPITQMVKPRGRKDEVDAGRDQAIDDLAFDIRAQRHMTFNKEHPDRLERSLGRLLCDMVVHDLSERYRRKFWRDLLGNRGEVAIITGALRNASPVREMVGDWDLRVASELTSYLSDRQYRPKIEMPIYQPECVQGSEIRKTVEPSVRRKYIAQLKKSLSLAERNCILIASPDVNPLTEIACGALFGVDEASLFGKTASVPKFLKQHPDAVLVEKLLPRPQDETAIQRAFYSVRLRRSRETARLHTPRGLRAGWRANEKDAYIAAYYSQHELKDAQDELNGRFFIHADLIVAGNPFDRRTPTKTTCIILNGVSGPATYALARALIGGERELGVGGADTTGPEDSAQAERLLSKVLHEMSRARSKLGAAFRGLHCIIKVEIAPVSQQQGEGFLHLFDWRDVAGFELIECHAIGEQQTRN